MTRADTGAPQLVFEQNHVNAKTARYFQEFLRDRIVSSGTVLLGKRLESSDARSERRKTSLFVSKRPFHDPRSFPFWTAYSDTLTSCVNWSSEGLSHICVIRKPTYNDGQFASWCSQLKGAPDADLRATPPEGAGGASLDCAREDPPVDRAP